MVANIRKWDTGFSDGILERWILVSQWGTDNFKFRILLGDCFSVPINSKSNKKSRIQERNKIRNPQLILGQNPQTYSPPLSSEKPLPETSNYLESF